MREHCCIGEGEFDGLELLLHILVPFELLWFVSQTLKEIKEMVSCLADETAIVVHHPQEALKLLDGGGRGYFLDGLYLFWKWPDAIGVDEVAKKLDGGGAQDAFFPVDDEAVLFKNLEDTLEIFHVLLH